MGANKIAYFSWLINRELQIADKMLTLTHIEVLQKNVKYVMD